MARLSFSLAGLALLAGSASATTLTSGSDVTMNFNGFSDSSTITGLTSKVRLHNLVFAFDGTDTAVTFDYSVQNTSSAPVTASRVSGFAFNTNPNIDTTANNSVTGVFDTVVLGANQPNGIGVVEICFADQGCPGGGSGGVTIGNTGTGSATLYFAGNISSFSIDQAYVRYQSVACSTGTTCPGSASGSVTSTIDNPVPEPATYGLMSAALAGTFLVARRRKSA